MESLCQNSLKDDMNLEIHDDINKPGGSKDNSSIFLTETVFPKEAEEKKVPKIQKVIIFNSHLELLQIRLLQ